MLRRVVAIATRSFYRRHHIRKKDIGTLYIPSTSLITRHYRAFSNSPSSTISVSSKVPQPPKTDSKASKLPKAPTPSIALENRSSFKSQFAFIATITGLSIFGLYKYAQSSDRIQFVVESSSNSEANTVAPVITLKTQRLIEDKMVPFSFKMALFFDQYKRYDQALYFYKLYLRKPSSKKGEYAALNNMGILYYKMNQYQEALICFELLGPQQVREKNLEFLCGH